MKILLTLENDLSTLKNLDKLLLSLKEEGGVTDKQYLEINLILDELCSNIILYGKNSPDQIFTVEISLERGKLVIVIEDSGIYFDPTCVEEPDTELPLEERLFGGLGIHLVRQYCSSCTYKRIENKKNRLTIVKLL